MPSFLVRMRKTLAEDDIAVDALSREDAISQVIQSMGPGEEVAISRAEEVPPEAGGTQEKPK